MDKQPLVYEKIFEVACIAKDIYRISEFGMATCYLVIGNSSALLIDTGYGAGNIRAVVEKLTDLPITIALTHAHPDHAGGAFYFDKVYLAKADNNLFFKLLLTKPVRTRLLLSSPASKTGLNKKSICKASRKTKFIPLEDGYIFDLGGKEITTMLTPGHTKGSAVFVDKTAGIIFTGDNVNTGLWMFVPGGVSIEDWITSAEKIYEYTHSLTPYGGHNDGVQKREDIAKLIEYAKELVAKTTKNKCLFKICSYPQEGDIKIIYRADKVLSKAKRK